MDIASLRDKDSIPWRENLGLENILLERGEGMCELREALTGLLKGFDIRLAQGSHCKVEAEVKL